MPSRSRMPIRASSSRYAPTSAASSPPSPSSSTSPDSSSPIAWSNVSANPDVAQRGVARPARDCRPRVERRARAGSRLRPEAHRRRLRRPPGTGRRRSRSFPRAAPDDAGSGHARRGRRRPGSGRRATGLVRERRRSAPGAARPCRHAPAPRQATDPSVHRSPGPGRVFVRSAQRACNWFVPGARSPGTVIPSRRPTSADGPGERLPGPAFRRRSRHTGPPASIHAERRCNSDASPPRGSREPLCCSCRIRESSFAPLHSPRVRPNRSAKTRKARTKKQAYCRRHISSPDPRVGSRPCRRSSCSRATRRDRNCSTRACARSRRTSSASSSNSSASTSPSTVGGRRRTVSCTKQPVRYASTDTG